jgi:hypothetical protein
MCYGWLPLPAEACLLKCSGCWGISDGSYSRMAWLNTYVVPSLVELAGVLSSSPWAQWWQIYNQASACQPLPITNQQWEIWFGLSATPGVVVLQKSHVLAWKEAAARTSKPFLDWSFAVKCEDVRACKVIIDKPVHCFVVEYLPIMSPIHPRGPCMLLCQHWEDCDRDNFMTPEESVSRA